ncbi:MAG: hypothetical protein KDB03_24990 [Planctomycetales bacterium]|nr:hypothetical protein [Planctomycetales bacterium]
MTKQLDKFVDLAKRASTEDSPRIDVRGRVMASISASDRCAYDDRIAVRFVVGSMSLAVVTLIVISVFSSQEPPLEMIVPFVSRLP